MIQLDLGNVLLKPSHRKQIMGWLRRASKIGHRVGHFVMSLRLTRCGRHFCAAATVRDSAGAFTYQVRSHDWRDSVRELAKRVSSQLHTQLLMRPALA